MFGCLAAFVLVAGCRALTPPEEPPRPTPLAPQWSLETIREHLDYFNSSQAAGRVTGTLGYANAAAYVAARLAEFELQPVVAGEFRAIYNTALHSIGGARLFTLSRNRADTLVFAPGLDFLPDGRSDTGTLALAEVVIDPGAARPPAASLAGQAVLLPAAPLDEDVLRAYQAAGARAILAVGALAPRPATAPLSGIILVQLTPQTAARLLGLRPEAVPALFDVASPTLRTLPRRAHLSVRAQTLPLTGALNVLGYVPGKNPAYADELVIVCADLDAVGAMPGVRTLDALHLGVGTAALLEVARQYAYFSQFSTVPERTILFAVFSGARQGHAGLQSYLRRPPWPLAKTHALLYAGLAAEEAPAVEALVAAYDLPFHALAPPPDSLGLPRSVLLPDHRPPREPTARPRGETEPRPATPRRSLLVQVGSDQALRLAAELHEALLPLVVPPTPLLSIDTLRVPASNE